MTICTEFGNELNLWEADVEKTERRLSAMNLDQEVVKCIKKIKQEDFCFNPSDYDGVFGELRMEEKVDILRVKEGPSLEDQLDLF